MGVTVFRVITLLVLLLLVVILNDTATVIGSLFVSPID